MALSFANQGIGTAKVGIVAADDKTMTVNGVNGELTNATQFATALEAFVDIVSWQIRYDSEDGYDGAIKRVVTQKVDGLKE